MSNVEDTLKMTKKEIKQLESELLDIASRIQSSDKLVMNLKDKSLRNTYEKQVLEMLDIYYFMEGILRKYPEEYNKFIKKMKGDPVQFIKRKLEKKK